MYEASWEDLKSFVDQRLLNIQFIDRGVGSDYLLFAFDGPLGFTCTIDHAHVGEEDEDQLEFETSYKSSGNMTFTDGHNRQVTRSAPFGSSEGFLFNGQGVAGVAEAGGVDPLGKTSNIDYTLNAEHYVNGMELFLRNQVFGDYLHFQVIDKDFAYAGILYPEEYAPGVTWDMLFPDGMQLNQFGTHWYVDPDACNQDAIRIEYPARLLAGFSIRLQYTSFGDTDVELKCNLFLHKPSQ